MRWPLWTYWFTASPRLAPDHDGVPVGGVVSPSRRSGGPSPAGAVRDGGAVRRVLHLRVRADPYPESVHLVDRACHVDFLLYGWCGAGSLPHPSERQRVRLPLAGRAAPSLRSRPGERLAGLEVSRTLRPLAVREQPVGVEVRRRCHGVPPARQSSRPAPELGSSIGLHVAQRGVHQSRRGAALLQVTRCGGPFAIISMLTRRGDAVGEAGLDRG